MKNKSRHIGNYRAQLNVGVEQKVEKTNEPLVLFLAELKQGWENDTLGHETSRWKQVLKLADEFERENQADFYQILSKGLLGLLFNKKKNQEILNFTNPTDYKIEGISELDGLIAEIEEDKFPNWADFLFILKKETQLLSVIIKQPAKGKMDELYKLLNRIMSKLNAFEIPQRKYVYKMLAEVASDASSDFKFISSEDFDFVETKYHQITEGAGQRIKMGLSFIVVDKRTKEVIKYGKVKVG